MAYHVQKLLGNRIARTLLVAAGITLFLTGCESSPDLSALLF